MGMKRLIAALSAVALLGACSAEAEPKTEPPAPSTTPTPSATATAGESLPSDTPEKAIRKWVKADSRMQNTGDSTQYLALTTGDCQPCIAWANRVAETYSAGGRAQGVELTVDSVVPFSLEEERWHMLQISSPRWTLYEESGSEPTEFDGGTQGIAVQLKRVEGRLLVRNFLLQGSAS